MFKEKELTSKQILQKLRSSKKQKRSKQLNCYYCEAIVNFKGVDVKLFFCKTSRRGRWRMLLSTDLSVSFHQAYHLYATRWSIEVFFKEGKQHLGVGKCQSQDFDAQIAHTTIVMLQYNLLSITKRFACYESLGELFRNSKAETIMLTLAERIWRIIKDLLQHLAESLEINIESLMEKLITDNQAFVKLTNYVKLLNST